LIALLASSVLLGPGAVRSSRLRAAATLIVSGVRQGLVRANTSGRPARLVLDLDGRRVWLEESDLRSFAREKGGVAAGAEAADEVEAGARAESEAILEGPRAPRARFRPLSGLPEQDSAEQGREIGQGVEFVKAQTERDEDPITRGRAYVYFWPGGLTERAAIQLAVSDGGPALTVLVSALTGRAVIERGRVELPPARSDGEDGEGFSEREEE
jgi:general secretion pathway protein H